MTRLLPSPAVIFATLALLLPPLGLYAPKALVVLLTRQSDGKSGRAP